MAPCALRLSARVKFILARAALVYPILGLFSTTSEKIPSSWRNVAMLGGVRGALSIVLLASIPSTVEQRDTIVTMVLGVAFLSITLQGPLLYRYTGAKFPSKRKAVRSESDAKLSATLAEIEQLRKARELGAILEEEFATLLDLKEKQIAQVVEEMKMANQTAKVLRSRAKGMASLFQRKAKEKKDD